MIRIILADDHAVMRKGLQLFISYEDNLTLIDEVKDGEELMQIIETKEADVLLLDLDMPKVNGLTIIPKIHELRPDIKVIILSMHPEKIYGRMAYIKGASAYVCKDQEPSELVHSIRRAQEGEKIFSPTTLNDKRKQRPIKFSNREVQVVKLLCQGRSNKEVGRELNISDKTVSTYKLRLLSKIEGTSTVDLLNFARLNPDAVEPSTVE